MKCPKCRKEIADNSFECPYCGTAVSAEPPEKRSLFGDKKRKKAKTITVKPTDEKPSEKKNYLKIFIIIAITAAAVITAAAIVMAVTSSKGERYSDDASQYIGKTQEELTEASGLHYKESSDYYGVNSAISFDYVYESDKTVKAQGITYPKWAVFTEISDKGDHISKVTYTDFSVIKKDMRGKKHDGQIDLGRFSSGAKQSAVIKEIGLDPYSITYTENGAVTYIYKYYYKRDNGDEQAVLLRVTFSEKGKYKYSSSELLIPPNM